MLFTDSIDLLEFGQDPEFDSFGSTFARSSILSSMLLPEVAANTCLETLNLERSIFQDVDKLSVLAKFDFYVRTTYRNRRIDRGVTAVQGLQEIKRLRDDYVHPKRKRLDWERVTFDEEEGYEEHVSMPEHTPFLQIPRNPSCWGIEHAATVMASAHSFLCYMFKDLCRLSATRTTALLFSEEFVPNPKQPHFPYFNRNVKLLLQNWGVDTSYLKLSWSP